MSVCACVHACVHTRVRASLCVLLVIVADIKLSDIAQHLVIC